VLLYVVDQGRRALTNAVFLLGAFMIVRLGCSVEDVVRSCGGLDPALMTAYRDATFAPSDFDLTLEDCWGAIVKAMELGWIGLPASMDDYQWGCVDVDEYAHYDDPLNGDLHEVVPGKFLAFQGPQDLGGAPYQDDERGFRRFSPDFYADVFEDYGVTAVVRLNEARYDGGRFEERGMEFHDLEFEDCTAPPAAIVEAFLRVADGAGGAVAVHCKAGLGRTGTLIGVYLMRRHGFTAREAMGWLRIVRPGSVIGEQQHYLCAAAGERPGRGAPGGAGARGACLLAGDVGSGMERRGACRARLSWAGPADDTELAQPVEALGRAPPRPPSL
jgi:cell division cycle 14